MPVSFVNNEEVETLVVIPRDGGWGWVVVLASFLSFFLIDGNNCTFGLYIESLSKEFNIDLASTSLIGSIMAAMMFIVGPIVSALLNRYDFRCVTVIGATLAMSGYALCSLTTNHYIFLASYGFLLGIGYGMMFLPAVIIPNLYFARRRALAVGIAMCASGFGLLVAPPVIEKLIVSVGWRRTYQILIGAVFTVGFATLAYKPIVPVMAESKRHQNSIYLDSPPIKETRLQRCCPCMRYSNKYYPTTNKVIPTEEAQLYNAGNFQTRRQTLHPAYSRATMRYSRAPGTSIMSRVSANFTQSELCRYNCLVCLYSECCENESKPMYRDDIFFSNSIYLIPKYQRPAYMMKKKMKVKERMKMKKLLKLEKLAQKEKAEAEAKSGKKQVQLPPEEKTETTSKAGKGVKFKEEKGVKFNEDAKEETIEDRIKRKKEAADFINKYNMEVTHVTTNEEYMPTACCELHISIIRAFVTLFHLNLFKSYVFNILAVSMFFFNIGNMIPFMYMVERAKNYGINSDVSCWFLTAIGGATALGRLSCGLFSVNFPGGTLHAMYTAIFICGVIVACSGICMEAWFQFVYAVIFGYTNASMMVLRPVVIMRFFGLENLSNCVGLLLMVSGVAIAMGPPLAGFLYDMTATYEYSYYFSGSTYLLSALLLMIMKPVHNWEERRKELAENKEPVPSNSRR